MTLTLKNFSKIQTLKFRPLINMLRRDFKQYKLSLRYNNNNIAILNILKNGAFIDIPPNSNLKILKIIIEKSLISDKINCEVCEICHEEKRDFTSCKNCAFSMCQNCDDKLYELNNNVHKCPICKISDEIPRKTEIFEYEFNEAIFHMVMNRLENERINN